jgi:hypothetical protein
MWLTRQLPFAKSGTALLGTSSPEAPDLLHAEQREVNSRRFEVVVSSPNRTTGDGAGDCARRDAHAVEGITGPLKRRRELGLRSE